MRDQTFPGSSVRAPGARRRESLRPSVTPVGVLAAGPVPALRTRLELATGRLGPPARK